MQDIKTDSRHSSRSVIAWVLLYFKGMAMGAADVVPGVSGGTVAFISGIYEELIASLKSCNPLALKVLFTQGPVSFWKYINGSFLLVLFAGIGSSLLGLVKVISWLIETYPQILWSFFSGLILASAWLLSKSMQGDKVKSFIFLVMGFALAWWISGQTPQTTEPHLVHYFFAGSIAICAMILPGISGGFLLLLMGVYFPLLAAIDDRNFQVIVCFAMGCGLGLLSFVHFLNWLLEKHKNLTFAVLVGFLLGSLKLLWPWKESTTLSAGGHDKIISVNVSPQAYAELGQYPPYLWYCGLVFLLGIAIIVTMHFISEKSGQNSL